MTEALIRINTLESAVPFHNSDPRSTPYRYDGFGKLPVIDYDWINYDPDTSSTNLKTRFNVTLEYHMLGNMRLRWEQSALTVGGGPSFQRYVDFFPYEAIDRIEYRYGSRLVQTIPRQRLYIKTYTIRDEKNLEKEMLLAAGGLSTSQRTQLATGTQIVEVELPLHWTIAPKMYLPTFLLEQPPTIDIFWRTNDNYIETDGTGPLTTSMSNLTLRTKTFYLTDAIQRVIIEQCMGDGIQYLFRDILLLEDNHFTYQDTMPYKIDISSFTHECVDVIFFVRWRNEVENGTATLRGMENLLPWKSFSLKSGAKILRDEIFYSESLYTENEEMLNGPLGINIGILYLSDNVTDETGCYGSKAVGAIITPTLNICPEEGFEPTEGNDLRIDLYALFDNIISMRYVVENGIPKLKYETIFV